MHSEPIVEIVAVCLSDDDPKIRAKSAQVLGCLDVGMEAGCLLCDAVFDDSVEVRSAAAGAILAQLELENGKLQAGMDLLVAGLEGTCQTRRGYAAKAFSRLGKYALPWATQLSVALTDEHAMVRQSAASALGNCGSPDACPALAAALRSDLHADVRKQAAEALLAVLSTGPVDPGEDAAEALLGAFGEKGPIQQAALRAAACLPPSCVAAPRAQEAMRRLLSHDDDRVRLDALQLLRRCPEAAAQLAPALGPLLRQASPDAKLMVLQVLKTAGSEAVKMQAHDVAMLIGDKNPKIASAVDDLLAFVRSDSA